MKIAVRYFPGVTPDKLKTGAKLTSNCGWAVDWGDFFSGVLEETLSRCFFVK